MKYFVFLLFIFFSCKSFSQNIEICFDGGFLNDSVMVEAVYIGEDKITKVIFDDLVNTVGVTKSIDKNSLKVKFDGYPRVFIKFYVNKEFAGGIQVDRKSKNKIRNIGVSNLFSGLVFNFSG